MSNSRELVSKVQSAVDKQGLGVTAARIGIIQSTLKTFLLSPTAVRKGTYLQVEKYAAGLSSSSKPTASKAAVKKTAVKKTAVPKAAVKKTAVKKTAAPKAKKTVKKTAAKSPKKKTAPVAEVAAPPAV